MEKTEDPQVTSMDHRVNGCLIGQEQQQQQVAWPDVINNEI